MSAPNCEQQNLDSARLILAERQRYGGVMASLVSWAEHILDRAEPSGQKQGILIRTSCAGSVQDASGDTKPSPQRPRCALEPRTRQGINSGRS